MRRIIWQFLLPIHHDISTDRAWWLPYREPCVSCQSPASAGLGSPGDRRSHSGHIGNTRRQRLITCCRLWLAAWSFWLGLHLVTVGTLHHWLSASFISVTVYLQVKDDVFVLSTPHQRYMTKMESPCRLVANGLIDWSMENIENGPDVLDWAIIHSH